MVQLWRVCTVFFPPSLPGRGRLSRRVQRRYGATVARLHRIFLTLFVCLCANPAARGTAGGPKRLFLRNAPRGSAEGTGQATPHLQTAGSVSRALIMRAVY